MSTGKFSLRVKKIHILSNVVTCSIPKYLDHWANKWCSTNTNLSGKNLLFPV